MTKKRTTKKSLSEAGRCLPPDDDSPASFARHVEPDGTVFVRAKERSVKELAGMRQSWQSTVSIEDMMAWRRCLPPQHFANTPGYASISCVSAH